MAFQTDVLRNGEWVTETVALDSVIEGKSDVKSLTPQPRLDQPPIYGILTRTVIESPVAHWMLPVRLRSAQHMDIAIIGVSAQLFLTQDTHTSESRRRLFL